MVNLIKLYLDSFKKFLILEWHGNDKKIPGSPKIDQRKQREPMNLNRPAIQKPCRTIDDSVGSCIES